jgi:phosphatidylserine synthase
MEEAIGLGIALALLLFVLFVFKKASAEYKNPFSVVIVLTYGAISLLGVVAMVNSDWWEAVDVGMRWFAGLGVLHYWCLVHLVVSNNRIQS